MRGTRALWSVVFGVGVVATVGIEAPPAFALDPPTTIPTITAPPDGATLSGDVAVSATSTADSVQFYLAAFPSQGDPLGAPVPVVAGVASFTWSTYGTGNGAGWQLIAQDCNAAGCNQLRSTPVNVTLDNEVPSLTSPTEGATTSSHPTLTADAPGAGAVAFYVDNQKVGVDNSAPFATTLTDALTEGGHTAFALGCNVAATLCSLQSQTVDFTVAYLHPQIVGIGPNPFSPNGDGRNDAATALFSLPDPETVTWTVTDPVGTVERGPVPLGSLGAGLHTFVWGGFDNAAARVPDGTYRVVVSTSATVAGVDLTGSATALVKVDTTAPVLGVPSGANTTFYPVRDGFHDTFVSQVSVNEPGTLWLQIWTTTGRIVRSVRTTHLTAGSFALAWDGLDSTGHLVPAGTYHFRWIADDVAANRRTGSMYNVIVSLRHIVTKTAVIVKPGSSYDFVDASKSCAGGSTAQSAFRPTGLRLYNFCSRATNEVALAQYSFRLPGAISYTSLRFAGYGFSADAPVGVGTLIWNFARNDADVVAGVAVTNRTPAWTALGGITASQHVSATHIVSIAIGLVNVTSPALYDIGQVRVIVTYRGLS